MFLDRTNIGNARLDNLEQDLHLHGLDYNNCLAVLFPFYIAAEIPSNMMMKRLRPSIVRFSALPLSVQTAVDMDITYHGGFKFPQAF